MKQRLTDWYRLHIIARWYATWTVWASALALIVPDLLQVALDNLDTAFAAIPPMDDATKAQLRIVLVVIIPIVRVIKQKPKDAP